MKALIRVDSGHHIGSGHLYRCFNLAIGLKEAGVHVDFLCRPHFNNGNNLISNEFQLIELKSGIQKGCIIDSDDYSSWIGVSIGEEIKECREAIKKYGSYDLLIIDHYSLDHIYEKEIGIKNIFVIDDLMNRKHDCKYLLDQNLSGKKEIYQKLNTQKGCHYFIGPQYALLSSSFSKFRPTTPRSKINISNILVFFGGSDPTHESLKVLSAYLKEKRQYGLKIILHESNIDYPQILQLSAQNDSIKLISFEKEMAYSISQSDLCFGASGGSVWERATLGVPSCIVSVADNQKNNVDTLFKQKAAMIVGDGTKTTSASWQKVFQLIDDKYDFSIFSKNSFSLCDGLGIQRIIKVLIND